MTYGFRRSSDWEPSHWTGAYKDITNSNTFSSYFDKFGVCVAFVLHFHDFYHVQVDQLVRASFGDCEDGVYDDVGQNVGHFPGQLCRQRGLSDVYEKFSLLMWIRLALSCRNFQILEKKSKQTTSIAIETSKIRLLYPQSIQWNS